MSDETQELEDALRGVEATEVVQSDNRTTPADGPQPPQVRDELDETEAVELAVDEPDLEPAEEFHDDAEDAAPGDVQFEAPDEDEEAG